MLKNIGRKVRFTRAADIKRTKHQCGHNKQTIECEDFWPQAPLVTLYSILWTSKMEKTNTGIGITVLTAFLTNPQSA